MSCNLWNDRLIERLYGEIAPEDDAALEAHLASCAPCRATLEDFRSVRNQLRDNEPALPQIPRVVVLKDRPRFRPALLAASLLGAAILAGAGAGAGYALGRGRAVDTASRAEATPTVSAADTEDLVRREVDRRLAAWESARESSADAKPTARAGDASAEALRAELAKFERRVNGARAADLDYVLDQIAASEVRVGDRIGKTNQALRTVALASNSLANEQ